MGNYRQKLLVERAMKRLDERTPMDARTPDRFTQKSTTQASKVISNKAYTAFQAITGDDFDARLKIIEKALAGYNFEDVKKTKDGDIFVKELCIAETDESGFVNDADIIERFRTVIRNKAVKFNTDHRLSQQYVVMEFQPSVIVDDDGQVLADLTLHFYSLDPREYSTSTKEDQLGMVEIYTKVVKEIRDRVVEFSLDVEKVVDQWDKAYKNTWGKNESIAYADLPWAEKTQTTVNEGKDSEKLFGNKKRLNEAIDRMFEDAVEIGANLKTEEEMMSK